MSKPNVELDVNGPTMMFSTYGLRTFHLRFFISFLKYSFIRLECVKRDTQFCITESVSCFHDSAKRLNYEPSVAVLAFAATSSCLILNSSCLLAPAISDLSKSF